MRHSDFSKGNLETSSTNQGDNRRTSRELPGRPREGREVLQGRDSDEWDKCCKKAEKDETKECPLALARSPVT